MVNTQPNRRLLARDQPESNVGDRVATAISTRGAIIAYSRDEFLLKRIEFSNSSLC